MNVPSPEDIAIETDSAGKAIRMIYMSRTDTSRIWERRIVKSPLNSAVFIRVLRGNHIVGEEQFHFQKTSVDTEKEATLITITYHEYLGFNPVERWLGLYFKYSLTRNYESDLERLELAALHRTLK